MRDEQARRTRRAIVTAAHDLFLAQGYAAATIDGIAEAAHVSRRTVFNSVGGKVAVLKLALDWAIVGDDEPIALADRPAIKAILAESDPRKALMLWVQTVADVAARTAPLGEVLIAAADIDPAAAELLAEASRNRMLGATLFIRYLAALDGLASGMTEQRAAELCWALTDGHLYRLLVGQRSWSTADFNRWLSESPRGGSAAYLNGPQPASRTRLRSRSFFARPYICLLIILRLTWPSTAPELWETVSPALTAAPRPVLVAGRRSQPDVPAVGPVAPNASPRPVRSTERRASAGTWSRNGRIASRAARISRPTCRAERIASTETRIPRSRYHGMMGEVTSW